MEGGNVKKCPVDYLSYMLRLWRTGKESAWKASLEDPQTGERRGFGSLNALVHFLQQQLIDGCSVMEDLGTHSPPK